MPEITPENSNSKIEKHLARLYTTALEQEDNLAFFKGINAYTEYVLATPILKAVVDAEMAERAGRYEKLEQAEKTAMEEMIVSKDKLVAVVKNNAIDTKDFTRQTTIESPHHPTILLELEAFARGEIDKGQHYRSDSFHGYLFDMASNLNKAGYGKELGDIVVSQEQYREYYPRIRGTNGYWFSDDAGERFIFSQTWAERHEQEALLERERALKDWGAVAQLIELKCAFDAVVNNVSFWEMHTNKSPYAHFFKPEDLPDIGYMAEDLSFLMGHLRDDTPRKFRTDRLHASPLDKLDVVAFKSITQTVHNLLMRTVDFEEQPKKHVMEKSNETALKILEQQYTSFATLTDSWDFFHGLAAYTKTIEEMMQTSSLVKVLEEQSRIERQIFEAVNTQALQELVESATKVSEIIAESAIVNLPTISAIQKIEDQMKGLTLSSDPLRSLENNLMEVARSLGDIGQSALLQQFEDDGKKIKNIYGNYTFAPTLDKVYVEEKRFERKERREPWGAWEKLPIVEKVIFEPEKLNKEFAIEIRASNAALHVRSDLKDDEIVDLRVQEMDFISQGNKEYVTRFEIDDYKKYVRRVHVYITTELIKSESIAERDDTLDYDVATSILSFIGKAVVISARVESDAHDLLSTIFKDRNKTWEAYEVIDDWGYHEDEEVPKNKVYQAGKAVNRIVAQHTTVKDFLVVTTKNVSINKAYLKK